MIDRVGALADVGLKRAIAAVMGIKLFAPPGIERWRSQDALHLPRAFHQQFKVAFVRQVVWVNPRCVTRFG